MRGWFKVLVFVLFEHFVVVLSVNALFALVTVLGIWGMLVAWEYGGLGAAWAPAAAWVILRVVVSAAWTALWQRIALTGAAGPSEGPDGEPASLTGWGRALAHTSLPALAWASVQAVVALWIAAGAWFYLGQAGWLGLLGLGSLAGSTALWLLWSGWFSFAWWGCGLGLRSALVWSAALTFKEWAVTLGLSLKLGMLSLLGLFTLGLFPGPAGGALARVLIGRLYRPEGEWPDAPALRQKNWGRLLFPWKVEGSRSSSHKRRKM